MAATFNRSLVFAAGRGTGIMLRARAQGNISRVSCWSPMMNLMRHPQWGRNHEGFGEDPYLSGELAFANIRGLQGHGMSGYPRYALAATGCKHFSTFDGPGNFNTAEITDEDWFWNYLPQFEQCVNAGSYSLMCSYARLVTPSFPRTPACENHRALTVILRETWRSKEQGVPGIGKGFVVSDCAAVHNVTASIQAGCDVSCGEPYNSLANLTRAGVVDESAVDQALRRVLYVRMRLGEWDPPEMVPFRNTSVYNQSFFSAGSPALEQLSREAAQQSMVLLVNRGVLPLDQASFKKAKKTVAVVGIERFMDAGYDSAAKTQKMAKTSDVLKLALHRDDPPPTDHSKDCTVTRELGCFEDGFPRGTPRLLPVRACGPDCKTFNNTHANCAYACFKKGYTAPTDLIGLEFGSQCSCGHGFNHTPVAEPSANCNMSCPGNATEMCGGLFRMNVFSAQCKEGPPQETVRVAQGCLDGPSCLNYSAFDVAAAVKGVDLAIVVIGSGGVLEGESRDLHNLTLSGHQERMVEDVLSANAPMGTVIVLLTTNPLNITGYASDPRVKAILHAGYPQHTGGFGIVDVLFGNYTPSGKLPYTWPVGDAALSGEAGDIGNYTLLGTNRTYRYSHATDAAPLFPFGHGLSYTSFVYSELELAPQTVAPCANVSATVTVTNTGKVSGAETVLCFIKWLDAAQATPDLQLVNFEKVYLLPGQSKRVSLVIDARRMAFGGGSGEGSGGEEADHDKEADLEELRKSVFKS
eukprot:g1344.t1